MKAEFNIQPVCLDANMTMPRYSATVLLTSVSPSVMAEMNLRSTSATVSSSSCSPWQLTILEMRMTAFLLVSPLPLLSLNSKHLVTMSAAQEAGMMPSESRVSVRRSTETGAESPMDLRQVSMLDAFFAWN